MTTDADLLTTFARTRSEAAFAELVRRHGPLVQGVCRRVLADAPEADDAFQATFLVLARKAGRVRDPGRLGPFLYGVAVRVAGKAKAGRLRRQRRERPMSDTPAPQRDSDWADVRPLLDGEVARLPDKLRAALVLCELQGVPRDEAAGRLGVPAGTLSSRLARAKDVLRTRLTRRGLTLSAGGLGLLLSEAGAVAAVPAEVVHDTAAAAVAVTPQGGSLVGKLLLMLLAAGGLTAAGVALVPGDKPPAGTELVGRWRVVSCTEDGNVLGDEDPKRSKVVTITPDHISFHAGEAIPYTARDGRPRQIDIVQKDDPQVVQPVRGNTLAVYRRDGDLLTLHIAGRTRGGRSLPRPADFVCRDGSESVMLVLERLPADAPAVVRSGTAADGLTRLNGRWRLVSSSRDGKPAPDWSPGVVFEFADGRQWVVRPDGTRQDEARVTMPAGPPVGRIDLAQYLPPGDFRPPLPPLLGTFILAGDELVLALGKPGDPRPSQGELTDGGPGVTVFRLTRESGPGRQKIDLTHPDAAGLRGAWRVVEAAEDGKPAPAGGTLTFTTDRLTFDRPGTAPRTELYLVGQVGDRKQLDLMETVTTRTGGMLSQLEGGCYKLDGDRLTLAFGWKGAPAKRPPTAAANPADPPVRWYRLERVT